MNFLSELENSLSNSGVDAIGAGLATYALMQDSNANVNVLGLDMPFYLAVGLAVLGGEFVDKMIMPYVRNAVGPSWAPWLERGNVVGTAVVAGALPAGLIYLFNPQNFSVQNWLMSALVILLGVWGGEYLFSTVVKPRTAEHIN